MPRLCLTLALALAACGPGPAPAHPEATRAHFVRASDGAEISREALVEALAPARVVLLGERHDQPGDHAMQRTLTEDLAARGGTLALGFEMFQRPYQSALDDYRAGAIDEPALLERTEWEQRWGFDFAWYRPLVARGRDGAVLLALNAPREVTRAVGRGGVESLSEAERAELPELDLTDEDHRALITEAFAGHPSMTEDMLARFYAAQVIWDETMADTVARHLAQPDAADRVIVYAGAMHVVRPAIPRRIERRVEASTAIVMPVEPADVEEARALADYLWVAEAEPTGPHGSETN